MNESEYYHPIWINSSKLSLDAHFIGSVLALKGGFMARIAESDALFLHYASLKPIDISNRRIKRLAKTLKGVLNDTTLNDWNALNKGLRNNGDVESLRQNLTSDRNVLLNEAQNPKSKVSTIYRKSIPDHVQEHASKTLRSIEKYLDRYTE